MPSRYARPYLQDAVQSVLAQKECLELLVADGGSTDVSLQVLEAFSEADPHQRIVSRSDRVQKTSSTKLFAQRAAL